MIPKKILLFSLLLIFSAKAFCQVADAGADQTICNNSTQLQGNEPTSGTGLWTLIAGEAVFINPNLFSTLVTNLSAGENILAWTIYETETSTTDNVLITNNMVAFAGNDFYSNGTSCNLAAELPSGASGMWNVNSGTGIIAEINNPNTSVTNLSAGISTFEWFVIYNDCISSDEVDVVYGAYAGPDQNVCDTSAFLNASPPPAGGTGVWSLIGGNGHFINQTLYNTQVLGIYDGVNTYAWTVYVNGSSSSDEVQIHNNRFDVYAGEDQTVSVPNATLQADPDYAGNGQWSVTAGQGVITNTAEPNSNVSNLQYGYNTFTWYVYNPVTGCSAYDDVNIIYNGLVANASGDQHICADTTRLQAEAVLNAVTWWSIMQGSVTFDNVTEATTMISNIARGENILRWNVSMNGYTSWDQISIFNYQFDTYAGLDQHLCEDSTYLDGRGMLGSEIYSEWTGQWEILIGGGVINNPIIPETTISSLEPMTNKLLWTVTRQGINLTSNQQYCRVSDTVSITYHDMPNTQFVMDPQTGKGCSPLTVEFRNTTPVNDTIAGTQYTWSRMYGGWTENHDYDDVFSKTFVNSSNTKDTIFYVKLLAEVEVADGIVCYDSIINPVTVWAVPKVQFVANPQIQYFPSTLFSISNTSSSNCNYYWDFGNGDDISQSSYVDYFVYDGYTTWGEYPITLIADNGKCADSLTITVKILAPEPDIIGVDVIEGCAHYSHEFTVNEVLYTTEGISEYRWDILQVGPPVSMIAQIPMNSINDLEIFTFFEAGKYWAKLYATGEGSNPPWTFTHLKTDTFTVYDIPTVNFEITPFEVMLPNQPIHCYNYSENAVEYLWDFGDLTTSTEKNPMHYYTTEGTYEVSLLAINEKSCRDSLTYENLITVNKPGQLIFPNAFAPDTQNEGDGSVSGYEKYENKVFIPALTEGIGEYTLQIFNRYGVLVFESEDINIGWTGYYNHKLCEKGAYLYKVTGKYNNGTLFEFTDNLVLLY